MKHFTINLVLLAFIAIPPGLFAGDEYRLVYRSPQIQGSRIGLELYPESDRFVISFATGNYQSPMEGYSLNGDKVWEKDISGWRIGREKAVPDRDMAVFTELSACSKSLTADECDYVEPEGYMLDITSGTVLYHSPNFTRSYPEFSPDGKYMLGKFGYGYTEEGGGDWSPSTGTCLIETDTGKEIWCKEVATQHIAMLSKTGGIVVGDRAIYDFYTGNAIVAFPQFAQKHEKVFAAQKPGNAVAIRAMSPDGRYFIVTEGKCDEDRVKRLGKENGCNLAFLKEAETYLGTWDKGEVKERILMLKNNMQDNNLRPFCFLPEKKLAVLGVCNDDPCWQVINMRGETVAEMVHEKIPGFRYSEFWYLNMEFDLRNNVLIWPSPNRDEFSVYRFDGKRVGKFSWKGAPERDFILAGFKMISEREYIFGVKALMTKGPRRTRESVMEVYRGKF